MNANNKPTPKAALVTLRVIWAGMFIGIIAHLILLAVLLANGRLQPFAGIAPHLDRLLRLDVTALLIAVPLGYVIRMAIYKRYWQGHVIAPQAYFTGNLVLLAMCYVVAELSLGITQMAGYFGWPLVPGVIAMAVIAVNFPTGNPLRPSEPDFGVHER